MKFNVNLLTIHVVVCLCMTVSFAKAQPTPAPLTCMQQCTALCTAWATFSGSITTQDLNNLWSSVSSREGKVVISALFNIYGPSGIPQICGTPPSGTSNNCSQVCPANPPPPKAAQSVSKGTASK